MKANEEHLADGDLFLLAFPPAGEPGALPPHLAACGRCARRLAEWERAAREVAGRPGASSDDFERAVMAKIRTLPAPGRRSFRGWATGFVAAAAVAGAIWLGNRPARRSAAPVPDAAARVTDAAASAPETKTPAMAPQDLADDALLRDVSRLVEGEDAGGWKAMAPLPETREGKS